MWPHFGAEADLKWRLYSGHRCPYDQTASDCYLTAKDPILFNGGDIDLYEYCLGDAVGLIDPLGLQGRQIPNYRVNPSNQYNPTNKIPKTTRPNIRYAPRTDPIRKVLPRNFKVRGINNLPGQGIPQSTRAPRSIRSLPGIGRIIQLFSNIAAFFGGTGLTVPVSVVPPCLAEPGLDPYQSVDEYGRPIS